MRISVIKRLLIPICNLHQGFSLLLKKKLLLLKRRKKMNLRNLFLLISYLIKILKMLSSILRLQINLIISKFK